jgi:hypothetical protein
VKLGGKNRAQRGEVWGIAVLAGLAVWFLSVSWRKWPDPIIDSGPQWYAIWRVSLGAMPYHDFLWNYGPLSLLYNGLLFRVFGPGMMVLACSNLFFYALIVSLVYVAFRMAWGGLGAFVGAAVFIVVFSFSLLNAVGNYNYVLPYSNETTHGVLAVLLTAIVSVHWCRNPTRRGAFALGFCGGLTAVLKPEFMLAAGALGFAGLVLRYAQRLPVSPAEYGLIVIGVILPTLLVSLWFWSREPFALAIQDACHGWRVVFATDYSLAGMDETGYIGSDNAWRNFWWELKFTASALLIVGALWAAGWFMNRAWPILLRVFLAGAAIFLASRVDMGGGFEIGPCLPGLIVVITCVFFIRIGKALWKTQQVSRPDAMGLALTLIAATLLIRMFLRGRINHFGFVQAAFAGLVTAAFVVAEVPHWTGPGRLGRWTAGAGLFVMLTVVCGAVVAESARNHALQTQVVGRGADRFYAYNAALNETGAMVNWCSEQLRAVPPDATLVVLPEGVMINYLSRHARPLPEFAGDEAAYIKKLNAVRPDYVVVIWGDPRDHGLARFTDRGQPGEKIGQWLSQNYALEKRQHGDKEWAFIFHRKPSF